MIGGYNPPMPKLTDLSALASIATAVAAVGAWGYYLWTRWRKRLRLERYLKDAKARAPEGKKGQHTIIHLMAECGMTEAEILDAAFRSKKISRPVRTEGASGHAVAILLEYAGD